jgi:hypothetical protein
LIKEYVAERGIAIKNMTFEQLANLINENCTVFEWIPLIKYPDYMISTHYPYHIKRYNRILKTSEDHFGYLRVTINGKLLYLHRIIAEQFIPNDDPSLVNVDHINGDRQDNHIENLRWVNQAQNCRNKHYTKNGIVEWFDKVDDLVPINQYNDWIFMNYFFKSDTAEFYYFDESLNKFCKIKTIYDKRINATDINDHQRQIYLHKLKTLL